MVFVGWISAAPSDGTTLIWMQETGCRMQEEACRIKDIGKRIKVGGAGGWQGN